MSRTDADNEEILTTGLEGTMFKTIAIVIGLTLVVGIAGVLAYAATKPDSFRVQRAATIQAPPDAIYPLINDLRRWTIWSPYEKKDPAMKRAFSGPASGLAPSMNGTATRMSARAAWRSPM